MLEIFYTNQFKKDLKKLKKRNIDISKLKNLLKTLINKKKLKLNINYIN